MRSTGLAVAFVVLPLAFVQAHVGLGVLAAAVHAPSLPAPFVHVAVLGPGHLALALLAPVDELADVFPAAREVRAAAVKLAVLEVALEAVAVGPQLGAHAVAQRAPPAAGVRAAGAHPVRALPHRKKIEIKHRAAFMSILHVCDMQRGL